MRSHPMWVRGLKHLCPIIAMIGDTSHPMWVRGLKQHQDTTDYTDEVAPYVGAWIETEIACL